MLCLGPKKSLSLPTLELKAQGIAQCTKDQSQLRIHSAIQAPPPELPPPQGIYTALKYCILIVLKLVTWLTKIQ